MKVENAVKELKELQKSDDPEMQHSYADEILLKCVDKKIKKAYEELIESAKWWVCA